MNRSGAAIEAIAREWTERRLPISSSPLPVFPPGKEPLEKNVEIAGASGDIYENKGSEKVRRCTASGVGLSVSV